MVTGEDLDLDLETLQRGWIKHLLENLESLEFVLGKYKTKQSIIILCYNL